LINKIPDHIQIYIYYDTDASKVDKGVYFAEIIQQTEISEKSPENCSLHTAKVIEIYKTTSYITNTNFKNKNYIILT